MLNPTGQLEKEGVNSEAAEPMEETEQIKEFPKLKRYRRSDTPDYDDEMTLEKELISTIKSHESEEEKLGKIQKLLEKKPNINFQEGQNNDTPLHIAVRRNELKVIELLIENGANIHIKNDRSRSPLDVARRLNKQEIVQVLKAQQASARQEFLVDRSQSEPSSQISRFNPKQQSATDTDYSKVNSRLGEFVEYFVEEFEARLHSYHMILEGEVKKVGKVSDAFAKKTGRRVGKIGGGVLGLFLGSLTVGEKVGALLGEKGAAKLSNKVANKWYIKEASSLFDMIDFFQKDKANFRKILVEAGFDVFQSFEMQFMRVTDDQSQKKAMQKLAKDAVSRAVCYIQEKESTSIAEGVLLGQSRKIDFGFTIQYEHDKKKKKWNTASLYSKVGLLVMEGIKPSFYKKKESSSHTSKYGYRRLLISESWNQLKEIYTRDNIIESKSIQFTDYQYILDPEDLEEQSKGIISNLNSKDMNLEEKRIKEIFKEVKDEIIEELKPLRKQSCGYEGYIEDCKILTSIENNLKDLKVDKYLKRFQQYFEEAKQEHQNILQSINEGREKNTEGFSNIDEKLDDVHQQLQKIEKVQVNMEEKINMITMQKNDQNKEPIWFHMRNPVEAFTGRVFELAKLDDVLKSASVQAVVSQIAVIGGLGGIGKSELARKYAYENRKDYDGNIVWIDAQTPENLKESFQSLAKQLGITTTKRESELIRRCSRKYSQCYSNIKAQEIFEVLGQSNKERDIQSIAKDIYRYFQNVRSLFIFDNANGYDNISKFLPSLILSPDDKKPYVLITSCNQVWEIEEEEKIKVIKLNPFSQEEAKEFIKQSLVEESLQEVEIIQLAEQLQYFPLALRQVVGYINSKNEKLHLRGYEKLKISDFLGEYNQKIVTLLGFKGYKNSDRYTKTVLTTWKVIFNKINTDEEYGKQAIDILNIMAYLASDEINIEKLFSKSVVGQEKLWNIIEFLNQYSIINVKKGMLNIHGLVQQVIRLDLQDQGREELVLDEALQLFKNNIEEKNIDIHIVSVWKYASSYSKLIEEFIVSSSEENNNKLLRLLIQNDHFQVIDKILEYIEENHTDELEKIINTFDRNGETLLHFATESNNKNIVEALLNKGSNPNAKDYIGCTPLHYAAQDGYKDIIEVLLNKGADLNTKDDTGWTPLYLAAQNGYGDIVKALLNKGADLNIKDDTDWTPLHSAAQSGYKDIVEALLNKGADPNTKDDTDWTPLHLAAQSGYKDVVEALLNKGADPNTKDDTNWTPLHLAAQSGNKYIVEVLLNKGADFNAEDNTAWTPLHYAAQNGNKDIVEILLSKGADFNAKTTDQGWTPLHIAAQYGYKNVIESLLNKGADFNTKTTNQGWTLLHIAAKNGHKDIVETLINKGADLNAEDNTGWTPLHIAARNGHEDTVEILINNEADLNAEDNTGWTPLHYAAQNGNKDIVEILLNKGADFNAKTTDQGWTPLHIAAQYGCENVIKSLFNKGADLNAKTFYQSWTPLHIAARNGHEDTVEALLNTGANFNAKDYIGWTPLHYAAQNGNNGIAEALLNRGADFDIESIDHGWASLHIAVQSSNKDIVETLINKGADLNAEDNTGWTPLHIAARNGHEDTVEILINNEADLNAEDNTGWTPLHYAAQNGNKDIVEILLNKGADFNAKTTDQGWTPLHIAARNGHEDTVEALLNTGANFNAKDYIGWTPLHYAAQNGNNGIAEALLNRGADFDIESIDHGWASLHIAVQSSNKDIVEALLNKGANFNAKDYVGWTPLHYAARNGNNGIAEALLNRGADFNIKSIDHGCTPLHIAARSNHKDIVETLLNNGSGFDARDYVGWTPLHYAAQNGNKDIVEVLLDKGADFNAACDLGFVPLHIAAKNGYKDIVELLLNKEADPNVTNEYDQAPLNLAATGKHWEIVSILLKHNANVNGLDSIQRQELLNYIQQKPEYSRESYRSVTDLFKSFNQQQEYSLTYQETSDLSSLIECLSDSGSGLKKSNSNRNKRSSNDECLLSWEDIDKFNEEKEKPRDLGRVKINSKKFIDYIENIPEEKRESLIQLANKVTVTGKSQGLVRKLVNNKKVMNHLSRTGKVSGITMHGMMAKNVLADFLNVDYQGVAINLGFIAGGQGFARVAQAASIKGTGLVLDGKLFLGRSLKAASPFLSRGTSAFVVYDLINQIKEFKNGNKDALVNMIGDSIYLSTDVVEVGIEVAEGLELLDGVSSITGPIGAAIGAMVFIGTDIYLAVKRVDKIDGIIHLTGKERLIEGLYAFIGIQSEKDIEELMKEKQASNRLVKQGLEYLKKHSDIQGYVLPTEKAVIDSCRITQYKTSVCNSGGLGGRCLKTRTVIRHARICTTKLQVDLDNKVLLDRKKNNIKWVRAKPDKPNGGKLFCLPKGDYESVPNDGAYLCENAIGITDLATNKTGNYTLINLGEGTDYVKGFMDSPNIFLVNDGFKKFYGGSKNDIFILQGNVITGGINGNDGIDTLDFGNFASREESVLVDLNRGYMEHKGYGNNSFGVMYMNEILARKYKKDVIRCCCDTKYVDGRGGESGSDKKDVITIPFSTDCIYDMKIIIRFNTVVDNNAPQGDFSYIVPFEEGMAFVNLRINLRGNHRFIFNYEFPDVENIDIDSQNNVRFNFLPRAKNGSFNISISYYSAKNIVYKLIDNTEIVLGSKHNLYALQKSDKSLDEIVSSYPTIASRLNIPIFVQLLSNNKTVAVGSGNRDVIYNNPMYESHLIGNGGGDVYIIQYRNETNASIFYGEPAPEIVIYYSQKENSTDTIDLRNLTRKSENDFQIVIEGRNGINDLLLNIKLDCHKKNSTSDFYEYLTIRLKDGIYWYKYVHIITCNVPMTIEYNGKSWSLEPLPLVINKDKEIVLITSDDVDVGSKIVVKKEVGKCAFIRYNENDLLVTNVFDSGSESVETCSMFFKDFYYISKMQTLSIEYIDKLVLLSNETGIYNATSFDAALKKYKDSVYNDVFNKTKKVHLENVASRLSTTANQHLESLDSEVVNGIKYLLASNGIVNKRSVYNCLGFKSKEEQQEFVDEYSILYNKNKLQQVLQDSQSVDALIWLIVKGYDDLLLKDHDKEKHLLLKDLDQCFEIVIDKRIIARLVRNLDKDNIVEKIERFIRHHQATLEQRVHHHLQGQGYNITTEHQRSRRAINNEEYLESTATRSSNPINNLVSWVKSSIGGLFNSRAALHENNTTQNLPNISQVDAQVDVNGTILLLDVFIRKITGQKHASTENQSISLLEAQANALNITEQFDMLLKRTARSCGIQDNNSNFNPIEVQSTIVEQVRNGNFAGILKTLHSAAKEAYPEFKQTDKFLNCLDGRLKEFSAEKEVELLVGKQKSLSKAISNNRLLEKSVPQVKEDKPNTFLNDTSISKRLSYAERVKAESSGLKNGVRIG